MHVGRAGSDEDRLVDVPDQWYQVRAGDGEFRPVGGLFAHLLPCIRVLWLKDYVCIDERFGVGIQEYNI